MEEKKELGFTPLKNQFVWMYNENEKINKKIKISEIDNYIQIGWKRGRKFPFK